MSKMDKKNNKIIHYIWFGGNPISDLTKKCIQTWKKFLPDFEIMEWNETNFDVNQCPFVKQAYEQKKWAFVADYTRFKVLEEYGGIYFDTDMEVTKDISEYLEKDLFMGCEDSKMINAAVVWAKEPHNPHIKNILDFYESKEVFNETGDLYEQSVPRVLTNYFEKHGFNKDLEEIQILDNGSAWIYPMEYFYPLSYDYQNNKFTDNSCMIHHFDATWISKMEKFKTNMKRKNMVWVVYIIDFFISVKNKIRFFSNYRDLTVFFVMFICMLLSMFSVMPIVGVNNDLGTFSFLTNGISGSVIQILVISALWTFVTAKIRNIDLNFYGDKMTNTDSSSGEFREAKLNLEQTIKFQGREKLIYIIQMILTVLVAFCPALEMLSIATNGVTLYSFLAIVNLYFVYLGVKKKFAYRILELVPYAIILALMSIAYPSIGILTSLATFGFITYKLICEKIKTKRIKSFVISYVAAIVVCLICNFAIPNINQMEGLNFNTTLISNERVVEYDAYATEEDKVTEFNAGKELFAKNIKNTVKDQKALLYPNLYVILSIIFVGILTFITKNKNYIFMGILVLLNVIAIMPANIGAILYISLITSIFVLLFLIENVIDTLVNRE